MKILLKLAVDFFGDWNRSGMVLRLFFLYNYKRSVSIGGNEFFLKPKNLDSLMDRMIMNRSFL